MSSTPANGWDVQYPNGDHHVLGLGSVIFNISHRYNGPSEYTLQWQAGGVLSDKNGDDGYKWCYRYTLLFWNPSVIDALAFQDVQYDESTTFVGKSQANDPDVGEIVGKFTIPDEKDSPRAVLPRGFGQLWTDDDHHVLQAAFDLGTPPVGGTINPTGNTLTWTSQSILVDNDGGHGHDPAEIVTIMSGQSVEMWQPRSVLHLIETNMVEEPTDLNLKPAEPINGCIFDGLEEYQEFYVVENVPFDYAIPALTGWDLQYECTNHEVERIGVFLADFEYVKISRRMLQGDVMTTPRTRARTNDGRGVHHRLARQTTLWLGAFAVLFGYFLLRYMVLKLPVLSPYTVGPLTFNTFGPLVAMGILFGIHLTRRWCWRFDLEWPTMQVGVAWVLSAGFLMAHLMAIGEASPVRLCNPRELLAMRSEFSSFGGFLGSTIAALYFCKRHALAVQPTAPSVPSGEHQSWHLALLPVLPQLPRCGSAAVHTWGQRDV